jgi:hypothetical protein
LGVNDRISFWVKALWIKNIHIFVASKGGLAQLARAFDWQSKGHRFDSDILHFDYQDFAAMQGLF